MSGRPFDGDSRPVVSVGLLAALDQGQDGAADRLRQPRPGVEDADQAGVHFGRGRQLAGN
jgi:hypothetical protein